MSNPSKPEKHEKPSIVAAAVLHAPDAPTPHDTRAVVLPAVVHFALDVVDRGQSTALGALHDARIELRVAVDGSLELADKATAAALRFARKLVQRADDLAAETLGGAERVLSSTVASARTSALTAAARLSEARASATAALAPAQA